GGTAVERGELRLHADVLVAFQHGTPEVGGELVGDLALFADGGAGVAAHGRRRGRIVEADARCVHVDRDDGRGAGGTDGEGRGGREGAGEDGLIHGRPPRWRRRCRRRRHG